MEVNCLVRYSTGIVELSLLAPAAIAIVCLKRHKKTKNGNRRPREQRIRRPVQFV